SSIDYYKEKQPQTIYETAEAVYELYSNVISHFSRHQVVDQTHRVQMVDIFGT
ncbi:hypothetical protein ACJX0J_019129, partial [Zea mays]